MTLRYLSVAGVALLGLMVSLEVDVGFDAPPLARLLFWALQIATGLVVLQSTLHLLTRRYGASRVPSAVLVVLSALLGAAVLAPVYWLIGEGLMERWLGYPARPDDDGAALGGIASGHPLLLEYLDIVGPLTAAWALICLPRLHWLVPPLLHPPSRPAPAGRIRSEPAAGGPAAAPAPGPTSPPPSVRPTASAPIGNEPPAAIAAQRPAWRDRLPAALGTDVIAVASELQYLRVWTPRGCALVLGALADVESEEASHGLRVHRSWWVACAHVLSVRRTATGAACLMSDGREVPVSRRRRAEVLARFGDGARYRVASASSSEAVAQAQLD